MEKPHATLSATPVATYSRALKIGVIGGVVVVSIALQGMMQAFSTRDIISGILTMSQSLLLLTYFGCGYIAAGRGHPQQPVWTVVAAGLAGLVASIFLLGLIWLGGILPLGDMFIAATGQMYDVLTFKQGLVGAAPVLLAQGLVTGIAAGILHLLPAKFRRPLMTALIVTYLFGLLQELIRITLDPWEAVKPLYNFLYESNGLSVVGAVALFVVVGILSFIWLMQGERIKQEIRELPPRTKTSLKGGIIVVLVLIFSILPIFFGLYLTDVANNVMLYMLMGLGLNIVVGFAGLLDLGYVAFFAIGAYTVGILTSPELATGILHNWWLALPFGIVVAVLAGVALGIPVLRMRGDYLAIVTLGFGEIVRILALSDFLKPLEGGAQGIQGIPLPNIGPIVFSQTMLDLPILGKHQFTPQQQFYYLFLAGSLVVIFIASRVKISRIGRAWMAMREDEDVAQAMGINLVATKLLAFGMGASFGGLAGAIFASKLQSVYPHSMNFIVSINVLSVIIVGGMGSIPGVILGSLAMIGLPELLREVGDYRYLFYGAALVIMMLVRPEGLLPEARRKLELGETLTEEAIETHAASPPPEAEPVKTPGSQ